VSRRRESGRKPPPWWTEADSAELEAILADLFTRRERHAAACSTCRALASPCRERLAIAREADAYDDAPLDAPPGFLADHGRRLRDHVATCPHCRRESPGHCHAVAEAIGVVLDWAWRRKLLSRAEYLRRREGAAA
jgi:hypothetical protein